MEILFSVFEKNTRPHVAYSNPFRPKTMFKATSTSFTYYLARKKRKKQGEEQLLVSRESWTDENSFEQSENSS